MGVYSKRELRRKIQEIDGKPSKRARHQPSSDMELEHEEEQTHSSSDGFERP